MSLAAFFVAVFTLALPTLVRALSTHPVNQPRKLVSEPTTPSSPTKEENFHQVLQRVGKTVFRPGGSQATRILQDEWCKHPRKINDRERMDDTDRQNTRLTVLELAAGVGTAGMEWASRSGYHVTVTDLDASRMEIARKMAEKRGLSHLVETSVQDMFHLDFTSHHQQQQDNIPETKHRVFDVAMVEAALTHFPRPRKVMCLRKLLAYADQVLIHEICYRGEACLSREKMMATKSDISRAVAIGFNPETQDDWKALMEEAGWEVTHVQTGPMRLLNPIALLEEEGLWGVARMVWNLATHSDLRNRVLTTKAVLQSHKDDIGFIILRGIRK